VSVDDAIIAANAAWITHARPIALAMLAMEAPAALYSALCDNHYGKDAISQAKTHDYREAMGYIEKARVALCEMLDGIRDNYRCDYVRDYPAECSEAEWDEIEAFNEELDRGMISVDVFVQMVEAG